MRAGDDEQMIMTGLMKKQHMRIYFERFKTRWDSNCRKKGKKTSRKEKRKSTHFQVLKRQILAEKPLNYHLKRQISREDKYEVNRIEGTDLKSIYGRLTETR